MNKWYIGKEGNTYLFHDMMWLYEVVEGDKVVVFRDKNNNPKDFDILDDGLVGYKIQDYVDNRHKEGSVLIAKI